jgi:competence protein ComEC
MKLYWSLWVPTWFLFFLGGILTCLHPSFWILAFLFPCIGLGWFFFHYRLFVLITHCLLIGLIALLCYGVGFFRTQFYLPSNHSLEEVSGKSFYLTGEITDWPISRKQYVEFPIKVHSIRLIAILPVQPDTTPFDIAKGDLIKAKGIIIQQKNKFTSPLSDKRKLLQEGAQGYFRIEEPESISIQRNRIQSHFQRFTKHIRESAWQKLCSFQLDSTYTHFLGALWLGLEKENFPLQPLFQKIGLSHILAISGSNFYWLAGFFLTLFTFWKWNDRKKSLFIIVILFLYCTLVGFQASTTRALLMISLMLAARSQLESYHSAFAMVYAAWLMLFWQPMWVSDIGFQLSFIGCSAFILFPTAFTKGIGATITTTPLVAYRFHLISLISLLTNLLFLPFLTLFYLLVLAFLLPGKIGFLPLLAGQWLWKLLILLMQFLSSFPYSFHHIRTFPLWLVCVYYLFLLGVLFWTKGVLPTKRITATILMILFVSPVGLGIFPKKPSALTVTYLNVGQGDATLIQTRNGKTILIDTGPGRKKGDTYDPGEKVLVPLLRKAGVNCIDLLIITHYHDDHYGGLPAVLENIPTVKEIVVPATKSEEAKAFRASLPSINRQITWHSWCGHHRWNFTDLELELFSPDCDEDSWGEDENNRSLCFLLTYQSVSFLFTGDIESDIEKSILDRYGNQIHCDIIKIPHHGSQTSSHDAFIEMAKPQFAVISCGSKALFRHPSDQTLLTLEKYDIPYHITFVHGSLQITTDGKNCEFSPDDI